MEMKKRSEEWAKYEMESNKNKKKTKMKKEKMKIWENDWFKQVICEIGCNLDVW